MLRLLSGDGTKQCAEYPILWKVLLSSGFRAGAGGELFRNALMIFFTLTLVLGITFSLKNRRVEN